MKKGFYKLSDNKISHAPNKVENKEFILIKEDKDTYTYPNHGWYWFDTLEEAETHFINQGWVKPEEDENGDY